MSGEEEKMEEYDFDARKAGTFEMWVYLVGSRSSALFGNVAA